MLYSASARRRAILQKRSSSRGSSRGSLASPPSSAIHITISNEEWPDNITCVAENDDVPSFQINRRKEIKPLNRLLQPAKFRAPFAKKKAEEDKKNTIIPATKKRHTLDPICFVIKERERVDTIREFINAQDYNAALTSLMSDAGEDFHYFNKLKNESDHSKQELFSRRHGKLKCSIDAEHSLTNERTCLWHGETDRGFPLRCHNKCLNHPNEKVTNYLGVLLPRPLDFCAYHTRYCIETVKHGDLPIKIRVPNEFGLCKMLISLLALWMLLIIDEV